MSILPRPIVAGHEDVCFTSILQRVLIAFWLLGTGSLLLGGVLVAFLLAHNGDPAPIPFDSAAWKATDPEEADRRLAMLDDLFRQSHRIVGKTRPEVEEVLGPPRSDDIRPELGDWHHSYYLLKAQFDDAYLVLIYKEGKVQTMHRAGG